MSDVREVDWRGLRKQLDGNVIVDGRNECKPDLAASLSFVYSRIGWGTAYPDIGPLS